MEVCDDRIRRDHSMSLRAKRTATQLYYRAQGRKLEALVKEPPHSVYWILIGLAAHARAPAGSYWRQLRDLPSFIRPVCDIKPRSMSCIGCQLRISCFRVHVQYIIDITVIKSCMDSVLVDCIVHKTGWPERDLV